VVIINFSSIVHQDEDREETTASVMMMTMMMMMMMMILVAVLIMEMWMTASYFAASLRNVAEYSLLAGSYFCCCFKLSIFSYT
jgi:uncharacterized membrane protein YjgN (DUF898 family)